MKAEDGGGLRETADRRHCRRRSSPRDRAPRRDGSGTVTGTVTLDADSAGDASGSIIATLELGNRAVTISNNQGYDLTLPAVDFADLHNELRTAVKSDISNKVAAAIEHFFTPRRGRPG